MSSTRLRVGQTLRPGQPGTRRHVDRYGDRLVCVRYRYDDARQQRVTTVEVIVDVAPSVPRAGTAVGVRVAWGEADVARRVKGAGGVWDARRKVWQLSAGEARRLGLDDRIVRLGSESLHLPTGH
ncbi:hypothetical protein [Rubrivirga sp.]|uniref:hypothetical protein n=1 Tax=Rubrivirga sp. TaxID=1885344 RepID=UPI003B5285FC